MEIFYSIQKKNFFNSFYSILFYSILFFFILLVISLIITRKALSTKYKPTDKEGKK